jgi:hypothetical protein
VPWTRDSIETHVSFLFAVVYLIIRLTRSLTILWWGWVTSVAV